MKGGRGSRSPSEFGGSLVDSDSMRLRELNRPKLSEVKFGIKRLMDDLGKFVCFKLSQHNICVYCFVQSKHFSLANFATICHS